MNGTDGDSGPTSPAPIEACYARRVTISLNGEKHDVPGPLTVTALLEQLEIDARRVAVELNLTVVRRQAFASTTIGEGDEVEIVNFVGGG